MLHCCFVLHPYIQSLVCFVFPVSKRLLKWSSGTTPSEICNPLWRVDLYGRQQEPTHPPLRTGEPDELSRRPSICPSGLGIGHSEVGNGKYSEQLVFFDRSDVMMWCFFLANCSLLGGSGMRQWKTAVTWICGMSILGIRVSQFSDSPPYIVKGILPQITDHEQPTFDIYGSLQGEADEFRD